MRTWGYRDWSEGIARYERWQRRRRRCRRTLLVMLGLITLGFAWAWWREI